MYMPVALRQFLVNLPRPCKQIMVAALDAVLLLASFYLALWARFEMLYVNHYYAILSLIACASGIAALAVFRVYFYILRYMNERVLIGVTCGVIVSVLTVTAVDTFLRLSLGLSRAVLIIYPLLALILLLGVRIVARRLLFPGTRAVATGMQTPVIIYGGGGLGSQLAAALRASPHYLPVAMIDDDPRKHRLFMAGLRIYPPSQLARLVAKHQVTQLLIAMPSASRTRIRQVVDMAEPFRLRIRTVSSLRELVDPRRGPRLRDIQVEDLLGRDPIPPIPELLGRCVTGRNIMITGAGGSIGSELCRQILELRPRRMVLFEISEPALYTIEQELTTLRNTTGSDVEVIGVLGSVRDYEHGLLQLRRHGIQTVYHAAAYKHVPIVEHNIAEGILTNTFGTRAMARAAIAVGVQDFVLISTDKAVRPTNVMGASKRLAEQVLQGCAQTGSPTRFSMVRFGNVLGSSGSVVPLFHKQILAGGPITLTHPDITRYFMTIPEAAQLVLQAGSMGESGSVFLLDMGEAVRIQDLAERMVHLYGLTVRDESNPSGDIEIRVTGLRPGEKLYEELLIGEDSQTTEHPRIMKARERCLPFSDLEAGLELLLHYLQADDMEGVLRQLRVLVPEYATAKH